MDTPMFARRNTSLGQRGATTLIVVMVLFFVMALAAVAAGRNQLFDSKLAGNYSRTEVAAATTTSGLDWALSMLNSGNISTSCQASNTSTTSFSERYLQINSARMISPLLGVSASGSGTGNSVNGATCTYASGAWSCQCNTNGTATRANSLTSNNDVTPTFDVSFQYAEQPGAINIRVDSCTTGLGGSAGCLNGAVTGQLALGFVEGAGALISSADAVLVSALKVPPSSPLVVQGNVDWGTGSSALALQNPDPGSHGVLAQVGGSLQGSTSNMLSLPGTPPDSALLTDSNLAQGSKTRDQFFQSFFAMWPSTYKSMPAVRQIADCPAPPGDCTSKITALINAGLRQVWIEGNATISSSVNWGTASKPIVLIVNGDLSISSTGGFQGFGMIAVRDQFSWTGSAAAGDQFRGAIVVGGNATFNGDMVLTYSLSTLRTIAERMGSYVMLPGSLLVDRVN